jgi:hypothetical protein
MCKQTEQIVLKISTNEKSSTSLVIKKMQILPVRMATSRKQTTNNAGEDAALWWECKLVQPLWRSVWSFLRKLRPSI